MHSAGARRQDLKRLDWLVAWEWMAGWEWEGLIARGALSSFGLPFAGGPAAFDVLTNNNMWKEKR